MTNDGKHAVFVLFLCWTVCSTAPAITYFCEQAQTVYITAQENGTIKTLEEGKSSYDNDLSCQWMIDAGEGNKIKLTVVATSLQWAPTYALCDGYDYLDIKDGDSELSPSIFTMCGSRSPYSTISTGRYLYLKFRTNEQNPFKYKFSGVTVDFQTFSVNSCPPAWIQLTGHPFCYIIPGKPEDGTEWEMAQHYCNFNQANLVIIKNESEFNFIQGYGVGKGVETVWIGLNDIKNNREYQWLDNTYLDFYRSFSRFEGSQSEDEDVDCVVQKFTTGTWEVQHCTREKHPFICKTLKGETTEIFSIPQEQVEDDDSGDSSFIIAITLGVMVGVVIVIGSLAVYCYLQGKQRNKRKRSQNRSEECMMTTNRTRPSNARDGAAETEDYWYNTTHTIDRLDSHERTFDHPHAPSETGPPTYQQALADSAFKL